jgi:hypothetical protein
MGKQLGMLLGSVRGIGKSLTCGSSIISGTRLLSEIKKIIVNFATYSNLVPEISKYCPTHGIPEPQNYVANIAPILTIIAPGATL